MLTFLQLNQLTEDATAFAEKPAASLGDPTDPGVSVHGIHYSHEQGLHELHGNMFGRGIKGSEVDRVAQSHDHRIKSRVYFYNKPDGGHLPHAESGLGPHVHSATLHGIFNPNNAKQEDRDRISGHKQKYLAHPNANASNAFESALVDSGFRGYTNGKMTVVLNHNSVPVKYEGHKHAIKA